MGPIFSPRVPITRRVAATLPTPPGILAAANRVVRRILRHTPVFLALLLCLSASAMMAQTPANVHFEADSLWTLNKWHVLVAITTLLVQAFLIVGLLITQARRRQAETESRRLAALAEQEHNRLDEVVSQQH